MEFKLFNFTYNQKNQVVNVFITYHNNRGQYICKVQVIENNQVTKDITSYNEDILESLNCNELIINNLFLSNYEDIINYIK